MNILFKAVEVFFPGSPFHRLQVNLHLQDGRISYLGMEAPEADLVVEEDGLAVSAGWLDLAASIGDPGFEHKETLQTAADAAARGGFTEIVCLPNLQPVLQSKNAVAYIRERTTSLPITIHPSAAVTVDTLGKDLTEMLDLKAAGAVAFTDGETALQLPDVLLKALLYLQPIGGVLFNRMDHHRLSEYGMVHEGVASTQLGLKGIPNLAEEVMVVRDLQLLEYAGGRLHLSLLSSGRSVDLVRQAKRKGLQVTCDVASYQLAFTDETMESFDTNYKVKPPFRSQTDREALLLGLADGTIDALVSAHTPQDVESKHLEFDLAEFGIINLETAFAVAATHLQPEVGLDQIINCLTTGPRRILGFQDPGMAQGDVANLTFFQPNRQWVPTAATTRSRSRNSPFFGKELTGRVYGIVHKNKFICNNE